VDKKEIQHALSCEIKRDDEAIDGTKVVFIQDKGNTETWKLIEGKNNPKYANHVILEIDYKDFKPITIHASREENPIVMNYLTYCDILTASIGIDLMKQKRFNKKFIQPIKLIGEINYSNPDVEILKTKLGSLPDDKIKKMLEIANSTEK
jgi:hypothetical protein